MKRYNCSTPPLYALENIIDFPLALLSGSLDGFSDPVDVAWLKEELKGTVVYSNEYPLNHFDFMRGNDTSYMNDVLDLMSKYATNDD